MTWKVETWKVDLKGKGLKGDLKGEDLKGEDLKEDLKAKDLKGEDLKGKTWKMETWMVETSKVETWTPYPLPVLNKFCPAGQLISQGLQVTKGVSSTESNPPPSRGLSLNQRHLIDIIVTERNFFG